MIGSSRVSLAEISEAVNSNFQDPGLAQAGRELLEIADLLVREKPLRGSLSDSGRSAGERRGIASSLLESRVSPLAANLCGDIVSKRWSTESDMVDAFELAGAQALFGACEDAGELDRVEDELFRFGRVLASNGDLQLALSSPALPAATKRGILTDLLANRTTATTIDLISYMSGHLRGRRIEQAIESLTKLAAERRGMLLAVVKAARPMTEAQHVRLGSALQRLYSQPIAINVEIDPALLGGLTVQIGDDVIDGSIANRIDNARRRVTG